MTGRVILRTSVHKNCGSSHLAYLIPLAGLPFMEWSEDELGPDQTSGKEVVVDAKSLYVNFGQIDPSFRPQGKHALTQIVMHEIRLAQEIPVDRGLEDLGLTPGHVRRVMEVAEDPASRRLNPDDIAQIRLAMEDRIMEEVTKILTSRVRKMASQIILSGVEILPSTSQDQIPSTAPAEEPIITRSSLRKQISTLSDVMLSTVLPLHGSKLADIITLRSNLFHDRFPDIGHSEFRLDPEFVSPLSTFIDARRLRFALGVEDDATAVPNSSLCLSQVEKYITSKGNVDTFDVPLIEQIVWEKLFPESVLAALKRGFATVPDTETSAREGESASVSASGEAEGLLLSD